MPKYKLRRAGEDSRVHKGKCASVINFDITEQCLDDNAPNTCDSYADYQAKAEEDTMKVDQLDTRNFEEIMSTAFVECSNSKSYQIRSEALTTVCAQLQLTHNPDFLKKNHDRLSTILRNSLDSNVPCEIDAAASVISVAAIQVPDSNRFYQAFAKPLKDILSNWEYQKSTRFAVYRAIGILAFLHETNGYRIAKMMLEFKDIFDPRPYFDRDVKKTSAESQVAALETWTFLMTLIPSGCDIKPFLQHPCVRNLLTYLEDRSDAMNTACAKAIALVIECGVEQDKHSIESELTHILDQLSMLIKSYNKSTSVIKSLVEVRQYLEKGIAPTRELRNGNSPDLRP